MSAPSSLAARASLPRVVSVAPGSAAAVAGVEVGDELVSLCGEPVRDVIQYRVLADEADPWLELRRGGLDLEVETVKAAGEPLGIDIDAAVFDRVRTCDNHCEFCFIYQLPPGMRRSLYLKDDDYRLSFLFGNFTTLTRFTEADLERVITEGLSPLYVSIHATDPAVRADLLHNRRGATSLRWLRLLLDHGVTVHGQIVVCPGLNDGDVLEDTLCGVADRYPELATLAVVPLGLSRYNVAPRMRLHTTDEARATVDCVEAWQERFLQIVGHRLVFAADEYYLMAGRPFPQAEAYGDFALHEDGIGMARAFETALHGDALGVRPPHSGFFAWSDGAVGPSGDGDRGARPTATVEVVPRRITAEVAGYRAPRLVPADLSDLSGSATGSVPGAAASRSSGEAASGGGAGQGVILRPGRRATVGILTGTFGAAVLAPLLGEMQQLAGVPVRLVEVENQFFGGNIGVTGLMVGEDLQRVLAAEPEGHRYLLPDVCLSEGRFLDGLTPQQLPRHVEIVPTDGASLRRALERRA